MLIDRDIVKNIIEMYKIKIKKILHIGAHHCEELSYYENEFNVNRDNVYWIEAVESNVLYTKGLNIPNVYLACLTDKDYDIRKFNYTTNGQSSSVLELGTHADVHPDIKVLYSYNMETITLDTFIKNNKLTSKDFNFWNIDVQGAELLVLTGGIKALRHCRMLYIEVNENELYKGCVLLPQLDEFLKEYHFERVYTHMAKNHITGQEYGWGDAIYIKH